MGNKKCDCKPGAPLWMSTFTDMNQLLLTFFILLLSMSSMDSKKIKVAMSSLQSGSIGIMKDGASTEVDKNGLTSSTSFNQTVQSTKTKMEKSLSQYVNKAKLQNNVIVTDTKRGVAVRIMDSTLFAAGSADIKEDAKPLLDKLAAVMAESPFNAMVEGHTDDIPMNTALYASNWELSTARAVNVVKYFIEKGVNPQKLSAAGYAGYHPVVPNISPESRAKNRRVEINFISPELAESNKNLFDNTNNDATQTVDQGGGQ